jgi:hypothetical protein
MTRVRYIHIPTVSKYVGAVTRSVLVVEKIALTPCAPTFFKLLRMNSAALQVFIVTFRDCG